MIIKKFIPIITLALITIFCFHSISHASETVTYSYDALDRLVSVTYAGAGSINYVYDQAGDIVNITITSTSSAVTDSDSDGIADDWERMFFNDLTTASPTTDADGDRYSDLWEYLNWKDALFDSYGNIFDPATTNSSHARGYGVGLAPREFISAPWIPLLLGD